VQLIDSIPFDLQRTTEGTTLQFVATMKPKANAPVIESSICFDPNRVHAVAVYCSDGRFGEQFDELLHERLQLPRYDRLAIPGGPACLATRFYTYREGEGAIEQLRFLHSVHRVKQVVLIAHEGCAYYTDRLHVSPLHLEEKQREDIVKAIDRVKWLGADLEPLTKPHKTDVNPWQQASFRRFVRAS
jgi:carbonic anhydrase-like protein